MTRENPLRPFLRVGRRKLWGGAGNWERDAKTSAVDCFAVILVLLVLALAAWCEKSL